MKSVYHINAVDEVTVLNAMLKQFPFPILGFHSDNGSEFVNHQLAKMLENLRAEFTRSRPRRSGDNGLVETKNGAVVRKHIGYGWLPPGGPETSTGSTASGSIRT